MLRFLFLNIFSKYRWENFFRVAKTNGLHAAIKKAFFILKRERQPIFNQPLNINTSGEYFSQLFHQAFQSSTYLPFKLNQAPVPSASEVKLIAFYLPQFHPVQENDEWWGKGFTEWTNVTKAVPQFIGHYQPHLPDQLGFYDLRLKAVQRQQIEIAKQYGIYGFCYHHYWFNKKRILETPLDAVLNDPKLDFPFCINWANENWTRRWDGQEQDVLLAQQHSIEDDLAFIQDVARYMQDSRYIRIDGKPLLMIYRPGLLPDVRASAERWRKWCRENSIGEIFLALTHSFEHVNPSKIGFDAAIDFAPNTYPVTPITQKIIAAGKMVNQYYQGNIFDYNEAAEYGQNQQLPSYKKFRGLFPGWDNESRRTGRGLTFINSSPLKFQQWLSTLLCFTQKNFVPSERLIFINAWNEWAEGAHLEPDRKYGFSYLEACRIASQLHALAQQKVSLAGQTEKASRSRIAIVIHAFYLDIFDEILEFLEETEKSTIKLFVTTPTDKVVTVKSLLTSKGYTFTCLGVSNRGRDILPFIKILPEIVEQKFTYLVKVHTKKTTNRTDGNGWRTDLYTKLLSKTALHENLQFFDSHPDVGIIAPEGHLLYMNRFLADNEAQVKSLSARLGMEMDVVMQLSFVAGSMYGARIHALMPLLLLNLEENEFELEKGQVDGTLAHAIERVMPVCINRLGYKISTYSGETKSEYAHAMNTTSAYTSS